MSDETVDMIFKAYRLSKEELENVRERERDRQKNTSEEIKARDSEIRKKGYIPRDRLSKEELENVREKDRHFSISG